MAVRSCHKAGIMVKMITGDHAITAKEIARQLNIGQKKEKAKQTGYANGKELEKLTDEELIAPRKKLLFLLVLPWSRNCGWSK